MAYPVVEDVTSVVHTSGATITGTEPASMSTGDVIIAVLAESVTTSAHATPTDWTQKVGVGGNASRLTVYEHAWSGSAPTYIFTKNGSGNDAMIWMFRVSGANATPIEDTDSTTAAGTSVSDNITTTMANSLVLAVGLLEDDETDFSVSGTGWTEGADENDIRSSALGDISGTWAYDQQATAATTDTGTISASPGGNWAMVIFAIPEKKARRIYVV